MAAELAEACDRRHTVASELLVGVTPETIVTRSNIADPSRGPARAMDYD
jgi:hypothetical protein